RVPPDRRVLGRRRRRHPDPQAMTMSRPSISRLLPAACQAFGVAFCLLWAVALVLFPWYKGIPAGYAPVALGVVLGLAPCHPRVRGAAQRQILRGSPLTFLAGVLLLGGLLRLTAILVFPAEPRIDDLFYHGNAVSMLAGGEYGQPGMQALFPPGMSLLLTGW